MQVVGLLQRRRAVECKAHLRGLHGMGSLHVESCTTTNSETWLARHCQQCCGGLVHVAMHGDHQKQLPQFSLTAQLSAVHNTVVVGIAP